MTRQLKEVAASHVLDEAGAHAYLHIGEIHRARGETEAAENAYRMVNKLYAGSPVAYTAMMYAGDTWAAIASLCEQQERCPEAISAWKKACVYYPDERRKYETAYVIGYFLLYAGKYDESHEYFHLVLSYAPTRLVGLREDSLFYDMRAYYWAEDYDRALEVARQVLRRVTSAKYREEAHACIDSIRSRAIGAVP